MIQKDKIRKLLYFNKDYEPIIRNRKGASSFVYIDGQKAFNIHSDSLEIKKDIFNVPANKIVADGFLKKEGIYTFNEYINSKKELLDSNSLYSVEYPGKIVFKFVNVWNNKPIKMQKNILINFLRENERYFKDKERLEKFIYIVDNVESYSLKSRKEKEELGLVYHEDSSEKSFLFPIELDKSKFVSLEDYLKFEFYVQLYTAKCNPLRKSEIGISKILVNFTEDENKNNNIINEVLEKMHISFVNYNVLFGGQDEKVFQDLLMKRRILEKLNSKLVNNDIKLVSIEEELDLPTKHRKNINKNSEDNGRIDNVYVNNIDKDNPRFALVEVKYNDTVISSFSDKDKSIIEDSCKDIGIYSHLYDLYYTLTNEEFKKNFYHRLDEVVDNIEIRNTYVEEEYKVSTSISKEKFDYLIVCGYDSEEMKKSIISKISDDKEYEGIKEKIRELEKLGVSTRIVLVKVKNLLYKEVSLRDIDMNTYQDITDSMINCEINEFRDMYLEN